MATTQMAVSMPHPEDRDWLRRLARHRGESVGAMLQDLVWAGITAQREDGTLMLPRGRKPNKEGRLGPSPLAKE